MALVKIRIENPFKTWWKARKYFKFPDITFHLCSNKYNFPYASKLHQGKLLDICIHDVFWKDKYDTPRHERNPLIYVCLFGKYSIYIIFRAFYKDEFGETKYGDMEYWEYMLDYLYYSKSLKLDSYWKYTSKIFSDIEYGEAEDGSEDIAKPSQLPIQTHLFSLNKRGLKEFKKLYE